MTMTWLRAAFQALVRQIDTIQGCFGLNVKQRLWFCPAADSIAPTCEATVCKTTA